MKKYNLFNYIEYIKDNPEGYWFKRRLYGWGWVPATTEGFSIVLFFIALVLLDGFWLATISVNGEPTITQLIIFFSAIIISITILLFICFKKGEKPKWTWGRIVK